MTKKTTLNAKYAAWIEALSVRYRQSQIKAAVAANAEMLKSISVSDGTSS